MKGGTVDTIAARLIPTFIHDGDPACDPVTADDFYARAQTTTRAAVRICAGCPLRIPCRDWALATGQRHGVWGGTTSDDRRTILDQRTQEQQP